MNPRRLAVCIALAAAALAFALPALAAKSASATAGASATIIRQLSITATAQMSFGKLHYEGSGPPTTTVVLSSAPPVTRSSPHAQLLPNGGETPAIRALSGQPSQVYTVSATAAASTPGGFTVNSFTFWTQNKGDITASHLGALDASGADTLRIGATLTVPLGTQNNTFTASPTITIAYQ